jgi:cell division protein FtsB
MANLIQPTTPMSQSSPPSPDGQEVRPRARRRSHSREARERRRRLTIWALWGVLAVLLINAVIGENGYLANIRVANEEAALRAEVAAIRRENAALQRRTAQIRDDPATREELARQRNYIRPGETLIVVGDRVPSAGSPPGLARPRQIP